MSNLKPARGAQLNLSHSHSRGIVADYLINEGGGSKLFDSSLSNNSGIISAAATWTPGKNGYALNFDGTDTINLGTRLSAKISNNFAVLVLLKMDSSQSSWRIAGNRDGGFGWELVAVRSNAGTGPNAALLQWITAAGPGVVAGSINIRNNIWHWILAIRLGGIGFLWIDGAPDNLTRVNRVGDIQNTENTLLGGTPLSPTLNYVGLIGGFTLWNRPFLTSIIKPYARYERPSPARFFFIPTVPSVTSDPYPPNCTITPANEIIGTISATGVISGTIEVVDTIIGEISG